MTTAGPSADLRQALDALAANPDAPPEAYERVARWRRACGDADAAATWQTWSLLPPDPSDLRSALAGLWRNLGDTEKAAGLLQDASWQQLALLLQRQELDAALQLQSRLLADPPSLPIAELLELLQLWQQQQQVQPALDLLQPLLQWMERRGDAPSAQLCNAMADLLEQQRRFADAEPWWQRSHSLQPQQAWPLMRLGHQALRTDQPGVALHYARQVLERDPSHGYAPRLQRKALIALDAHRSLALLEGSTPAAYAASSLEPPGEGFWDGCRCLGLIGFTDPALLCSWVAHLSQLASASEPMPALELWLIASPDPLWLERQAQALLAPLAQPHTITSWPVWDHQRHGALDRTLEARATPPGWQEREPKP